VKNKIKETAAKLFSENGYTSTSMREIAEALGVTKAALYYHYPNKEAIFRAVVEDNFREHLHKEMVVAAEASDAWAALYNWSLCTSGMTINSQIPEGSFFIPYRADSEIRYISILNP